MLEEDNNGRVAGDGDSSGGAIVVGDGDSDGGDEDSNGVTTDGGKNTVGRTAHKDNHGDRTICIHKDVTELYM